MVSEVKGDGLDTRDQVMRALKISGPATVLELAVRVDVSPVTVRHHLSGLQAEGLVEAEVERRSVGRPHHVFRLTDAGEEMFPRKYLSLSRRLLDQIKANLPPGMVTQLLRQLAQEIVARRAGELEGKSPEQRLVILAEILEQEGFMSSWERTSGEVRIVEHNCPYRNLGREHPDICTIDDTLIRAVLDAPTEQASCLLRGDQRCVYVIQVGTVTAEA